MAEGDGPTSDLKGFVLEQPAAPSETRDEETIQTRLPEEMQAALRAQTEDLGVLPGRATIVILVGDQAGASFPVSNELRIGRSHDCSVVLRGTDVSREHMVIQQTAPGEFELSDLGSRNGTLVNGVPITSQVLRYGDRIALGSNTLLLFTHRDDLEEQLLHLQRMESLGRLAGGIAHDFNNLLGTVMANASVLSGLDPETKVGSDDVQGPIADVKNASYRAASLTKQLLAFARRGEREAKPTDLSALIADVVSIIHRTFPQSIVVDTVVEPALSVIGDSSQLHQVLMNLCLNAQDAMPDGGILTIHARKPEGGDPALSGPSVLLAVEDTGIGMTEEVKSRVFEPFFTTKERGRGTGLGLATVYGIVKNHGGDVVVDTDVGKGSTFRVRLPLAPVAKATLSETLPPERSFTPLLKGTILIVDDDELFLRSSSRMLRQCGYGVMIAKDGTEALDILEHAVDPVQLVLLDVAMPVMDGKEVCRQIRQRKPHLRILGISGLVGSERDMISAGAHGFLAKPCDRSVLERKIHMVLTS